MEVRFGPFVHMLTVNSEGRSKNVNRFPLIESLRDSGGTADGNQKPASDKIPDLTGQFSGWRDASQVVDFIY